MNKDVFLSLPATTRDQAGLKADLGITKQKSAEDSICNICEERGHLATVCSTKQSGKNDKRFQSKRTEINSATSSTLAASQNVFPKQQFPWLSMEIKPKRNRHREL
ncbi:hypothetical protein J6590_070382 [Homalodisca vitripennis]|nr:hypothetical protein J6590_070382 [Homalodisca vitripennis]